MTDGGVDFGRDGSARYVGAFPGRDLRCAEEHRRALKVSVSPGESPLSAEDCICNNTGLSANSQEMLSRARGAD